MPTARAARQGRTLRYQEASKAQAAHRSMKAGIFSLCGHPLQLRFSGGPIAVFVRLTKERLCGCEVVMENMPFAHEKCRFAAASLKRKGFTDTAISFLSSGDGSLRRNFAEIEVKQG